MQEQDESIDEAAPEEVLLWQTLHQGGDQAAEVRESLISRYLWLARSIAHRALKDRAMDVDLDRRDLVQLATVGLIEAVDRYDQNLGVPFAAYAKKRIHGAVISGIDRESEYRAQVSWLRRTQKERTESVVEASSAEERLRRLADVTVGLAIGFMLEDAGMAVSDEHTAGSRYDANELLVLQEQLRVIVTHLSRQLRKVVELHYFHELSFSEVASILGLTKGRVSQIHGKAILDIRQRMKLVGTIDLRT